MIRPRIKHSGAIGEKDNDLMQCLKAAAAAKWSHLLTHTHWQPFVFSSPPCFILLQFNSHPYFFPSVHAHRYSLCPHMALNMRLQHVTIDPVVALIL